MKQNILTINKEITSVDIDFNLETKLSQIFLFFQEVSSLHSTMLGIGKEATVDKNLHWVITRFNLDITRFPLYEESVKVLTYPGDNNGIFFYRHYRILDKDDNVLIKACSIWLVLNAETGQIVKDPFNGLELPKVHLDDELEIPAKINKEAYLLSDAVTIKYSDIDLNNHLNNTRYIELIQNAIPMHFYQENNITGFAINYLKELKAGDKVDVYIDDVEPTVVKGMVASTTHFIAEIKYKKRQNS